ncbi:hypothetical protein [Desulfohalovibrio reitneri]|uniref:hypothetical protein n=1 Tax=Desulfohalovibrio reitneri TaxID=1307759 RepID=UPI0004A748E3|nr:hypothetical protein [Desulfohalovibrio reitneri]
MIACLPFFPNAGGADWLAPEAAALLGQTLAGLARLEGVARVALYTDSARAAALASGLEVVRCSAPRSASLQGRVAELLGDKLDGGTAVLGLDPRNPFLHPDDVYGALRLHAAAPDTPVLSVAVPRDHPAQLRQYYDVPAAGLVLRFDPEPPEEARELARGGPVSREFPLAWGEAVPEADTLSLDAAGRPDLDGGDSGSVLLRTGRGTARLVWRGATADGNVLGPPSAWTEAARPRPGWFSDRTGCGSPCRASRTGKPGWPR